MLIHLELNNFKKHSHIEVDFTAGLNGIVGPNYAGKSTLLNGIMFCLGGSRFVPGSRLQTRDTVSGFKQSLVFQPRDRMFHVERSKSSAHLREAPEGTQWVPGTDCSAWPVIASGTSPVNGAVARLLGMPLRRFAQIKYCRQKKSEELLRAGSTELFKIISELTGIEKVTDALAELSTEISVLNRIVDTLQWTDVEPMEKELAQVTSLTQTGAETVTGLKAQIREKNESLQANQHDLIENERSSGLLRIALRKYNTAMNETTEAQNLLERRSKELQEAQEAKAKQPALTDLRSSRDIAVAERARAQQVAAQGDALGHAVKQAETALKERETSAQAALIVNVAASLKVDQAVKDLGVASKDDDQLKAWRDKAETLRNDLATARAAVRAADDRVGQIQKERKDGVCSACQRPFDEKHDEAHFEKLLVAAQNDREREQALWGKVNAELLDLQEKLLTLDNALSNEQQAEAKTQREAELLEAAEQAYASACKALDDSFVREPVNLTEVAQIIASYDQQIEAVEAADRAVQRAQQQKALAVAERDRAVQEGLAAAKEMERWGDSTPESMEADGDALRAEISQIQAEVRSLGQQLDSVEQELSVAKERAATLKTLINTAQRQNENFEKTSNRLSLHRELHGYISKNRDRYTKQVWDVFTASASMFVSSATGGRISEVTRSEKGEFGFVEDGHDMTIDEASGAQASIMGLAVQMALADAAPTPLDVILLDEPSADCDAEHSAAAMALLAASGKQVIAVTHRELDNTLFSNTIQLGRTDNDE